MFVNLKPPSRDQHDKTWQVVPWAVQCKNSFMKFCPVDVENFCVAGF